FLPLEPQPERLELLLARVAAIAGRGEDGELRAGSPVLLDSHRPEAFRMQRFDPHSKHESAKKKITQSRDCGTARLKPDEASIGNHALAFRAFRPPRAATVELRQGMPARIYCADAAGPRGDITWLAGPWRSSGDWWNPAAPNGNSPAREAARN